MRGTTAWRTDEPCPTCGADLVLLDDGASPLRWECRMCGDAPVWLDDDAPAWLDADGGDE
jgi:ribosomal protein S27AE